MTKVKEFKELFAALPDDFWLMVQNPEGVTQWAAIEVDTKNKTVVFKQA